MRLGFVFPRLQTHYRTGRYAGQVKANAPLWHISYPDASKIQRAVEDAVVTAGWIPDDRYIAHWVGTKQYGPIPGVLITLEVIDDPHR
jgi:Holliday junction resolvase RusA-like endonuclease